MQPHAPSLGLMAATAFALAFGALGAPPPAQACPVSPYLGAICVVSYGFCPTLFEEANGRLVSYEENPELFELLGKTYGGDGLTTIALPDMRGRVVIGVGQGPGQPLYALGQTGGEATITPTVTTLTPHTHVMGPDARLSGTVTVHATTEPANVTTGQGALLATPSYAIYGTSGEPVNRVYANRVDGTVGGATESTGAGAAIENRPAFLTLRYCIATQGIYPNADELPVTP